MARAGLTRSRAHRRLVLAIFTVLESVGDQTVFWRALTERTPRALRCSGVLTARGPRGRLPLYNETKVVFVTWLWHPRTQARHPLSAPAASHAAFLSFPSSPLLRVLTRERGAQGAAYAYGTIVAPLLQRHEAEVDRHLAEASARVGDVASSYYTRAATHLQSRFAQLLQSLPQQPQARPSARSCAALALLCALESAAAAASQAGQAGPSVGGFVPRNANEAAAMAFKRH